MSYTDNSLLARIRRERLDEREPNESARDEDWWPGPIDLRSWTAPENARGNRDQRCPICGTSVPYVRTHIATDHTHADCGIPDLPEPTTLRGPYVTGRRRKVSHE